MKLDAVPSVDISIHCDSTPLLEYEDEADDREGDLVGVKYVEATCGSKFAVFFTADQFQCGQWPHVSCKVKLDGKDINASVLEINNAPFYTHKLRGVRGNECGQPVLRCYTFADLETNDDSVDHAKAADFKNIGEIEIKLYSCRIISSYEDRSETASMTNSSIPEKALKGRAISNRATLGKAEPAQRSERCQVEYDGNEPTSFATYIFKYRSRRDLQIEGLIPRSPSPVPPEERDLDDLSPEEMRELLRRKRAQGSEKEGKVKVKQEKRARAAEDDGDNDGEVTIIEERSSKRIRQSTDSGAEVVDLTDD